MAVEKHAYYKCNVCGSAVVAVKEGEGTLVCCDQPMEKVEGEDVAKHIERIMPKPGSP
jgi:superoxide reductase